MKTKTNTNYADFNSIIYEYDSLPSTQVEAKRLALSGIKKAIIVAKEQTNGKGRCGRNWESPHDGGLYVSFLIRPKIHPSKIHLISFAAGLAVVFCLKNSFGINTVLKWPNDVIIEEEGNYKKISGILSETAISADEVKYCIVGIGINCKREAIPPELVHRAYALDECVNNIDNLVLLEGLSNEFFKNVGIFELGETEKLLQEYASSCSTIGKTVQIEADNKTITGMAIGIGESGELLVKTENGIEKFSSADVYHATICKSTSL